MKYLSLISIIACFFSCSKPADTNPTPTPQPGGTLIFLNDSLKCINPQNGSVTWRVKPKFNLATYLSAINYDSGLIYHQTEYGIACYNLLDGNMLWFYNFTSVSVQMAYSSSLQFKDSLAYCTTNSNSGATTSKLFCFNKRTGVKKWEQTLDLSPALSFGGTTFSPSPAISGNRILAVGRYGSGSKKLMCFNNVSGALLWEHNDISNLLTKLRISDNKIYAIGGTSAYCLDTAGNTIWQKPIFALDPSTGLLETFIDNNRIIRVAVDPVNGCRTIVLDKLTGNRISSAGTTDIGKPSGCSYKDNTLFFVYNDDTAAIVLRAYDLNNMAVKWSYATRNRINIADLPVPRSYYENYTPPVITPDYIIFGENITTNNGNKANFTYLNRAGQFIKEDTVNYSLIIPMFIYLDNGTVYKSRENQ